MWANKGRSIKARTVLLGKEEKFGAKSKPEEIPEQGIGI